MEYSAELQQEKEYTAMVQQLLYAVVNRYKEYADFHDESIRMLLADAWEELRVKPTALSPQDLEQLSSEIDRFLARKEFSKTQVARYEKMLLQPFFARVDFCETGTVEKEKIVIGLYSLKSPQGPLLVHDWRAPVCSLYYEQMPGEVSYDSPSGVIKGEMTLKRQYRMENGKLVYFVDTDVSIDDAMLLDILSHATSSHMRNIVSTIQKEQNAAIRHEKSDVLCVVGSAGSGKTSVAMHRAAYLMYQQRMTIDASRIAVLSPSAAFTEYISSVLSELGEENAQMTMLHSLYKAILGREVETQLHQQETLLSKEDVLRKTSVAFKSGPEFVQQLSDFVDRYTANGPAFSDIALDKHILISQTEMEKLYREEFALLNPAQRLSRIKAVIDIRLEGWTATLSKQYEDRLLPDYKGKELETAKKFAVAQRLQPVHKKIREILDVSMLDLYAQAVSCLPQKLREAAAQNAQDKTIWWEDAPAIAYLLLRLGFVSPDKMTLHVLVDEAQDYADVTLSMLHLYYPKAHVTILGDPNQRTCPAMPPCNPESWGECFGKSDAPLIKLSKCYRSTLPITRLCNALLPGLSPSLPVGRDGDWPVMQPYDRDALDQTLTQYQNDGAKLIAIVTRNQKTAQKIARQYPKAYLMTGSPDDMLPESDGVVIGSYSLMKGLEFDGVIVVWDDVKLTDEERRRLYTACSRALHKLCLFAGKEIIDELGIVL